MRGTAIRPGIKNRITRFQRFLFGLKRPSKAANARKLQERGENIGSIVIREAAVADIPRLAALHVKAWNETYWTVRRTPTYEVREYQWKEQFKNADDSWFCYVVENGRGDLVGFAKGLPYADDNLPGYSGELNKIYLLLEYQRLGIGRRLMGYVARAFLKRGITNMVLFGIPQNPSCAFHEALGADKLYAKNGEFHGGYGWRDLQQLAFLCPAE